MSLLETPTVSRTLTAHESARVLVSAWTAESLTLAWGWSVPDAAKELHRTLTRLLLIACYGPDELSRAVDMLDGVAHDAEMRRRASERSARQTSPARVPASVVPFKRRNKPGGAK